VSAATPSAVHAAATRDLSIFVHHQKGGMASLELAVEGMRCAGCMASIERAVMKLPGVITARVNFSSQRLGVDWQEGILSPDQIMASVASLGFRAYPFVVKQTESREADEEKRLLRYLGVAAFAAMNIMLLSVSVWSGNTSDINPETRDFFHWLSALIALPAAAYAGQPFFESAIRALKVRKVNMDVPITLGILLALSMSVVETLNHGQHAYFDSAVMLIFFLLIGRYLDQAMRRKTRAVAGNLAALKAETATKFISEKEVREVPIAAVHAGDRVLVRPGERVSVDGTVTSGQSEIDQSLITGETDYALANEGTVVYAGTLNVTGTLKIRVSRAASGTLLDEVNQLLERATSSRSQHLLLADRAARLYAPLVHATALLTVLGWVLVGLAWQKALTIAITVLIITCPCALGLAVPAVQVVAAGALFRRSVLLNQGDALERLAEIDTVIFDKTGTLTMPTPQLANTADIGLCDLKLAGRLALASRHPLSRAIVEASGACTPLEATEVAGLGVRATLNGKALFLGRPSYCDAESAAAVVATVHPDASLMAFCNGERTVIFAIQQALRSDAGETIERLKALGLNIEILSGDRGTAVANAARALGIATFSANLAPADKIRRIERLKAEGRKVLMVGDGLNDAPALAAAYASVSPVTAVHLTQTAADAVFLGSRLAPVLDAVAVSRKARSLMVQNLWLAVIYNAVAVPLAIAGYATPLVAALAMSGSSLIVTLNALRAQNVKGTSA
jgi:P-type Cu2+ transporter